jgi:MFS family permease
MSGFHAAYSIGGLAGAGLGGLAAAGGLSVRLQFFAAAVLVLTAGGASAQAFGAGPPHPAELPRGAGLPRRAGLPRGAGLPPPAELAKGTGRSHPAEVPGNAGLPPPAELAKGTEPPHPAEVPGNAGLPHPAAPEAPAPESAPSPGVARRRAVARWPQWSWPLVCLAAMSFGSFLGEGAANDWSAVYLHSSLGAPAGLAAVGYTVFSCTMTVGRLAGDRLADLAGPARLVRWSAGVAGGGFGAALLAGRAWSALAGFAVLGAGLSVVVPLVFSATAGLGRPGPNLALVTSSGYLGTLAGPALIGGVAEAIGLPAALGIVVLLCVLIAVLARTIGIAARGAPPPREILLR